MSETLRWAKHDPEFGATTRYGACEAIMGSTLCGYPLRSDGTCMNGHPARPEYSGTPRSRPLLTPRESLAEALSWSSGEMTRWLPDAHPDHNRWSWRGDGHGEVMRDEFRKRADALFAAGVVRDPAELAEDVRAILVGIDRDECESDDGWWETSTGAEFGAGRLAAVLAALAPDQSERAAEHLGGNAEDCPACAGTNPPYPFLCPGTPEGSGQGKRAAGQDFYPARDPDAPNPLTPALDDLAARMTHVCDSGNFDRSICPEPCGAMHSYCDTCGERQDSCAHVQSERAEVER